MIGHAGFHSPPGPEDLAEVAPDGVEFGYAIHAPFRRRGYASEAVRALMYWAYRHHRVNDFVLTVLPKSKPAMAMARSLGFEERGSRIDHEDGLEIYFIRHIEHRPEDEC